MTVTVIKAVIAWIFPERQKTPTPLDLAFEVIEASLLTEPETWLWSRHAASKGGVSVWIANKDYGINVSYDTSPSPGNLGNGSRIPGAWRKRLWAAVSPEIERIECEKEMRLADAMVKSFRSSSMTDKIIPAADRFKRNPDRAKLTLKFKRSIEQMPVPPKDAA